MYQNISFCYAYIDVKEHHINGEINNAFLSTQKWQCYQVMCEYIVKVMAYNVIIEMKCILIYKNNIVCVYMTNFRFSSKTLKCLISVKNMVTMAVSVCSIYIYIYMCVCVCVCVYAIICIYTINTHTHIYIL